MGRKARKNSGKKPFIHKIFSNSSNNCRDDSQPTHERGRVHVRSGSRHEPGYSENRDRRQVSIPSSFSRRKASTTTSARLPSIPRQGLFKGRKEKGKAIHKRCNGRRDHLNNDHVSQGQKSKRSKSAGPDTATEYECRSNTSVASAPSVPSPRSTVYDTGPYSWCDCPCRKFDITRKSWAVMHALQELYDDLCNIQCTSQSCMDWQPSSTTYIVRDKLVAGTATLTSALSSQ